MDLDQHARLTGSALKRWFLAQTYDAAAVAGLWFVGLLILGFGVFGAAVVAVLAFVLQYIPHFGPVLTVAIAGIAGLIGGGLDRFLFVLTLYAVVVVIDGLVLQPVIMKRTARVPVWASILAPLVLGFFFSFWGVLLAAPILAIVYAYRSHQHSAPRNQQSAVPRQSVLSAQSPEAAPAAPLPTADSREPKAHS